MRYLWFTIGGCMGSIQRASQAKIKFFAALQRKKERQAHRLFVAAGEKLVHEALAAVPASVEAVVGTEVFWNSEAGYVLQTKLDVTEKTFACSAADFARITDQQEPEGVLAIVHMPAHVLPAPATAQSTNAPAPPGKALVLAGVQDPGNLGTLLRTADWFGFTHVYCGLGTAEAYNPKVVRATMGAIFRVQVHYVADVAAFVAPLAPRVVVAGMHGTPLPQADLRGRDILLLGGESHGVPPDVVQLPGVLVVTIARAKGSRAESLNVGTAAGILCHALTHY
jgi:TrmH family RNA methyltransferase